MKDFDQLKDLWQGQQEPKLSYEEVKKSVRSGRTKFSRKILLELLVTLLVLCQLFYVWSLVPVENWTTHLGLLILSLVCIYYFFTQVRDYFRISKDQSTLSVKAYIDYLKAFNRHRYRLFTRDYWIYAIIIAVGFLLYFIDTLSRVSPEYRILTYSFTVLWFAFVMIFLRKRVMRKEKERIELMIDKLQKLEEQLQEKED